MFKEIKNTPPLPVSGLLCGVPSGLGGSPFLMAEEKQANVYILLEKRTGLYKIGVTKYHPVRRIYSLKKYGFDLEIIFFVNTYTWVEKDLHAYFEDKNVRIENFTEFFQLNKNEVDLAIRHLNNYKI